MFKLDNSAERVKINAGSNYIYDFFKRTFLTHKNKFINKELPPESDIKRIANLILHKMPLPTAVFYEYIDDGYKEHFANKETETLIHILFVLYAPEEIGITDPNTLIQINDNSSILFHETINNKLVMKKERTLEGDIKALETLDSIVHATKSAILDVKSIEHEKMFLLYDKILNDNL